MHTKARPGIAGYSASRGLVMAAVLIAGGAVALGNGPDAGWLALPAVAAMLIACLGRVGTFPRVLALAVAVILGAACLRSPDPLLLLLAAAKRASFYGAFMLAVIALRDPVDHSGAFIRTKQALTSNGSAPSYPTLLAVAHVLSLVLHMGSISLLGSLSKRTDEPQGGRWMALATLHGFVTTTLWSPLSVAPAIVMSHLAGVNHAIVVAGGFCAAMAVLAGSMLFYRIGPVDTATDGGGKPASPLPLRDFGAIALYSLAIFVLLQATGSILHVSPMASVVLTLPCVIIAWTGLQALQHRDGHALGRWSAILFERLPRRSDEVLVMVLVGLLGPAVSDLLGEVPLARMMEQQHLGAAMVLLGAFWVVVLAALAGLNGLVTVVVLMESIPTAQQLGVPAEFLALVFIGAWALSAASSALSPATLLVSDAFGTRASTVAFDWNRPFSIIVLATASLLIVLGATWFSR